VTVDELLAEAPIVLAELTGELFRRCHDSMLADATSQHTACFFVALRAASLLHGMESVLRPDMFDSFETLSRSYVEARDLLMSFRFDDRGARDKIGYWFVGAKDNAWKADHTKSDEFLTKLGADGIQLAQNWSKLSVLSHPTKYAAENSAVVIRSRITDRPEIGSFAHKKADYLVCISRLIMAVIYDLPGWIALGCDGSRMPHVEEFCDQVERIAPPILNAPLTNVLPETSIRTPKKNAS
jgi:hypothetical protein